MDDLPPTDPDLPPEPEPAPPPLAKVLLGAPSRQVSAPIPVRTYQYIPERKPPFWKSDFFKFIIFLVVIGAAGGGAYYQFFWLNRLPQERELTDVQGKSMDVNILAHDDVLLKYSLPGSATVHYLSLATLSPPDQEFIAKLAAVPLAKLPFYCTLTDSTGKGTPVSLMAHDDNWAQCSLIADGSTQYIYLSTLAPADQAVIRLLPAGLRFNYPMDYVFTGPPRPGANVQLLGHNDDTVEYLVLATGVKYFAAISELSQTDQSFVREFPPLIPDRPPAGQDNGSSQQAVGVNQSGQADANSSSDSPVHKPGNNNSAAFNEAAQNAPLTNKVLNSLVFITGDYSKGSGFIAKLHDDYFVVTNDHVLSGNKEFTITGMKGNKIPTTGPLYGAIGYDVAILKIPESVAQNYLEIMDDPQNNAKIGDRLTVPGNSLGADVPTQINGELVAVGPQLIEVSAQLQHGISGSPIIDRPSGKVIGIATMSVTYKINPESSAMTTETRWFGYRLDNIDPQSGWVKMDWTRFRDEGLKVRNAVDLYNSLSALLTNKSLAYITSEPVQSAINDFQEEISLATTHKNRQDIQSALQTFNSKLRSLADSGTNDLNPDTLYPYHASQVKELMELRRYMDQAFEDNRRTFQNVAGGMR